jgi:GT2 family glycosyltransferase
MEVIERSVKLMRLRGIDARVLSCPILGCPASRNRAAAAATGDLLFFLDNDAVVDSRSSLAAVVELFQSNPNLAIVSFNVLLEDSSDLDPFAWVYRRSQRVWRGQPFETFTFAGTGFCARASAYRQAEGFWERLIYSREEEELSYALLDAGWQLTYNPAVSVRHYPSGRGPTDVVKRRSIELVNGTLVLWRRLPFPLAIPTIFGRIISMTLRATSRDYRSVLPLWRSVLTALREVKQFDEPRRPISLPTMLRLASLHLRRRSLPVGWQDLEL